MGGTVSNVFYANVDNETKAKILEDFKKVYSDKNIKQLDVHRGEFSRFYIYIYDVSISFMYEPDLIDFICELNRPFVFSNIEERGYCISFVYGKTG